LRFLANKSLYLSNGISVGRDRDRLITNRKSYTGSRLAPNSMTLNDLERQSRWFYGFFWRFRAATQVCIIYKFGTTILSLPVWDPDKKFGIRIL